MPGQVPFDISDQNSLLPEPVAPHTIERETGERQSPEPLSLQSPDPAYGPEAPELEQPAQAETPQVWPIEPPAPAIPVASVEWDTNREPVESGPAPLVESPPPTEQPSVWQVDPLQPIRADDPREYDAGRNTTEGPSPIEWVDRAREAQTDLPVPPTPEPTPPLVDPRRLNFRSGPKLQQTYWVS